eukprot:3937057-Rhodomonas_salina.1
MSGCEQEGAGVEGAGVEGAAAPAAAPACGWGMAGVVDHAAYEGEEDEEAAPAPAESFRSAMSSSTVQAGRVISPGEPTRPNTSQDRSRKSITTNVRIEIRANLRLVRRFQISLTVLSLMSN